jgi:hypothetical protein
MRSREDILTDIASFRGKFSELKNELSTYPWDSEEPVLIIGKLDFSNALKKCIRDELNFGDLVIWANIIESRDDIDFEVAEIQEAIFELVSPEINGDISKWWLQEIINELEG